MTSYLDRFPLFAGLAEADRRLLEQVLVVQDFPAGHVLFREGDHAAATTAPTWLILDGTVRVQARAPAGGWGLDRTLPPGHFVGLNALLTDLPRSATCTTASPVTLARLDRVTLEALLRLDARAHARLHLALARHLAGDLRDLSARVTAAFHAGSEEPLRAVQGPAGTGA